MIFSMIFSFLCFFTCSCFSLEENSKTSPVICDLKSGDWICRNFRQTINEDFLSCRSLSGSGQMISEDWETILERLGFTFEELLVVDLRGEPHGYINGIPVCWPHEPLSIDSSLVEEKERDLLHQVHKNVVEISLSSGEKLEIYADHVETEREWVESRGGIYIRIPVADHHHPQPEIVDILVEFLRHLPSDRVIHVHCKAGKGRTTSCLAMFDIIHFGLDLDLDLILDRHVKLGGSDLRNTDHRDSARSEMAQHRIEWLKEFYTYRKAVPDFSLPWSVWRSGEDFFQGS